MRIIMTSKEKADETERRNKAYLQALECPECGTETSFLDRTPIAIQGRFRGTRHVYRCECKKCGCEWETDEW